MTLVGGIELGGTKIRVARGTSNGRISECATFATEAPEQSLARIISWFRSGPSLSALGVGAFGPVGVRPDESDYGRVLNTPKLDWRGFDIVAALQALDLPIAFDTDVNAAGLAEARAGALMGIRCGVYLTVGTGIGGALIVDGRPIHGASHPEMGHMPLLRLPGDESASTCPYHDHCAEGLASGPAVIRRFGATLSALPSDHSAHELIADYLGQLLTSIVLIASPERIVIGGGVSEAPGLHAHAHNAMRGHLAGYLQNTALAEEDFVRPPALAADAGLAGALMLAGSTLQQ